MSNLEDYKWYCIRCGQCYTTFNGADDPLSSTDCCCKNQLCVIVEESIRVNRKAEAFLCCYVKNLKEQIAKHPEKFRWKLEDLQNVAPKCVKALLNESFNIDNPAIQATCKELGVPKTYGAIRDILS